MSHRTSQAVLGAAALATLAFVAPRPAAGQG